MMKPDFIPLDKLSVSPVNMRGGRTAPHVSDILPSVRQRGVIQTLLVRRAADRDPRRQPCGDSIVLTGVAGRGRVTRDRRRFAAAGHSRSGELP
jgi:ParB family chromosome partitioning protein